jgi:hypothetical protein
MRFLPQVTFRMCAYQIPTYHARTRGLDKWSPSLKIFGRYSDREWVTFVLLSFSVPNHKNRTPRKRMTYYLRFRDRPLLCQVRIKGKDLAVPFNPDTYVDICITLKAILIGFLDETFFTSVLLLSFGLMTV